MVNKLVDKMQNEIAEGSIIRTLLVLGWPIMLTQLFQIMYNLVDTYWLGKVSVDAVAAPTIVWPMVFLLVSIAGGLSVAGVALVSQYAGAKKEKDTKRSAGQVITLLVCVGTLISIAGIAGADIILRFIGAEGNVFILASPYIKIIFSSMPWMFLITSYSFVLRGWGDTRTPMYVSAFSVGLNILIDPVLIFGVQGLIPPLGVTGAAIATLISRSSGGILVLYLLFFSRKTLSISRHDLRIEKKRAKQIFCIGAPASIGQALVSLGFIVMVSFVARAGIEAGMYEEILAAYGIGTRIISIIFVIIGGLTGAAVTMIGQNVGAEKPDRAVRVLYHTIGLTMFILFLYTFTFFIFRDGLYRLFIDNPIVIKEGGTYLTIFGLSTVFFGAYSSSLSAFQGSGRTVPTMILGIVRLWLMRIPFCYLLAFVLGYGVTGLWWGMAISNATSATAAFGWAYLGRWKEGILKPKKIEEVEAVL